MSDIRVQVESGRIKIGNDCIRCTTDDACLIQSLLIQLAERFLISRDGESVCMPVEIDEHYQLPSDNFEEDQYDDNFEEDQTCYEDFPIRVRAIIHLTATKNDEEVILRLVHILDQATEFKWSDATAFLLKEKDASEIYYIYPYPFGVYKTQPLAYAFLNAEDKTSNRIGKAENSVLSKQLLLPEGIISDRLEEIKKQIESAFVEQLISDLPKYIDGVSDLDALVQALQSKVEVVRGISRRVLKQYPSLSTLKALLAAQQWREADEITSDIIFDSIHAQKTTCSMIDSLRNIPYEKLSTLDQAWLEHSQGKFGFSVQVRIWQDIDGNHSPNWFSWSNFGQQVGWYSQDSWLYWNDLNFTLVSLPGHLPRAVAFAGWGLGDFWNGCRSLSILTAKLISPGTEH
jgi:hypothetical protein